MSSKKETSEVRRSLRARKVKEEEEEEEQLSGSESESEEPFPEGSESDDEDSFSPEALGLHRVGTEPKKKKSGLAMNNRGRPARMRKKNPMFSSESGGSEKKQPKKAVTPVKTGPGRGRPRGKKEAHEYLSDAPTSAKRGRKRAVPATSEEESEDDEVAIRPLDKKEGQKVGMRLRNLLKLPKAHKFVSYEWFYSNIDRAILGAENDFQTCLRDCFPTLITKQLTRTEWNRIRHHLGKPRRCSSAFFEEERRELERRRQKIRLLQTKKIGDPSFVKDLPTDIPLPLEVGAKVTARLRTPQDGLFTGTVETVDAIKSSYSIKFDRPGLGTHNIPDYEVASADTPDTLTLATITQNFRPRRDVALYMISPLRKIGPLSSIDVHSDPLLGGDSYPKIPRQKKKPLTLPKDQLNGYSIKLLETMVRMKKLLSVKQSKLSAFKKMNVEAELQKTKKEAIDEEFQKKYAYHVVGMEKLNRDILNHLSQLQTFSKELSTDPNVLGTLAPSYMREKCRELAVQMVEKNNSEVHDEAMLKLITNLTTVMWISSYLNNNDQYGSVINVLESGLFESKCSLDPGNAPHFEKHVESQVRHIQLGLHKKAFQRRQQTQKVEKKDDDEIIINRPESMEADTIDPIQVNEEEVEALNRTAQENTNEGSEVEEEDNEEGEYLLEEEMVKAEKKELVHSDEMEGELLLGD